MHAHNTTIMGKLLFQFMYDFPFETFRLELGSALAAPYFLYYNNGVVSNFLSLTTNHMEDV
jgi:hypothetical protein